MANAATSITRSSSCAPTANQRAALQVFPFLILPQYFFAGVIAPLRGLPHWLDAVSWAMPLRYPVNLVRAAFYAGHPGYGASVAESPLPDIAVMTGLFSVLLIAGAALLNHRERSR